MQKKIFLMALLISMGSTLVHAQSSEQNTDLTESVEKATVSELSGNCTDPEYRQLDFWVGEWDLSWTQADGSIGKGQNIISHDPYGNCVIMENFDGAPAMNFKGMSVSTFHKPAGLWRQAWVDDNGGYFSLYGGPQDDGTFKLDMERLTEAAPYRRMVWKNIESDSLDWHWQGKTKEDDEWADLWVINYQRK